jgi:outer membrane protein assembly factor BamD
LALAGCAGKKKKPELAYEERPVELLYNAGAERLDKREWTQAVEYFQEVERQHPYSVWARRAILMQAFAHYEANNYDEAIADADRFLQLYPGNPSAAYARYLKAICYFEQIADVGRDQDATNRAIGALQDVVQRYPNSEYAADARIKIDMANDQLAGKEMNVGRWYLRQGDTLAAIGRFTTVVDHFQTTSDTPEALYRLVVSYLIVGLPKEAERNGAVLGYNYPGDPWYGQAYKLLTAKGYKMSVEPKKGGARGGLPIPFVHHKNTTIKPPAAVDMPPPPAGTTPSSTTQNSTSQSSAVQSSTTQSSQPVRSSSSDDAEPKPKHHFHIPFTHPKADNDADQPAGNTTSPAPAN